MKRNKSNLYFKRIVILISCIASIFPLCSCLNPVSLEEYGYVVTIGVGKGKKERFEFIFELQRESSGDESDSKGGAKLLGGEGKTIFDVINTLSENNAQRLNFTRTHFFVFSESVAREGLIEDFFTSSFDALRIRQSAMLLVTSCSIRDFFGGLSAQNIANIAKLQQSVVNDYKDLGLIGMSNASGLLEAAYDGVYDVVTPVGSFDGKIITDMKQSESSSKGENPLSEASDDAKIIGGMQSIISGSAIFDGWRMTGRLGSYDTQLLNLGNGEFKSGSIDYKLSDSEIISFKLRLINRSVEFTLDNGKGHPKAAMYLDIDILPEYNLEAFSAENWENGLKLDLENHLKNELNRVFDYCQKRNSDAMGFGRYAVMEFNDTTAWEKYDWKSKYENLEASFDVMLTLEYRDMKSEEDQK